MTSHLSIAIITIGDGWLVVEKPAGISIHNDPGKDLRSRLALRVSNDQRLQRKIDFNPDYGFHAVGRLDKGADGLVLVAWRSSVFAQLAGQYTRRETQKEYKALLYGQLRLDGIAVGDLLWAWSLSKGPCGRGNPAGRAPRVPCETNVNILETASNFTLVACRPSTGRKHQIRRHAALSGHPLAGDRRYGLLGAANRLQYLYDFRRIGLHASALTFKVPESGQMLTVTSRGMPSVFGRILKSGRRTE